MKTHELIERLDKLTEQQAVTITVQAARLAKLEAAIITIDSALKKLNYANLKTAVLDAVKLVKETE